MGLREKGGRESKAEARNTLKEKASKAKAEKKAEKKEGKKAKKQGKKAKNGANGHAKPNPDVLSKAKPLLSEIVALVDRKKPSDPYVKGLMDGARYSMGDMAVEDFAPAWRTYLKAVAKIEARQDAN